METSLRISAFFVSLSFAIFSSMATEGTKVGRIDTHAHFTPQFYYDILISKGATLPSEWNVIDHLAFMDSMGIELSVLASGRTRFTATDVEEGRKLARRLNEYGHMLTATYPERFQFFATLTLPDVEGAVAEAIYAMDTLKAAGVLLVTNSIGEYVGSKRFDPLMELLNAREATVFIHPTDYDVAPVTIDMGGKNLAVPGYVIDWLLDTTRAALNIVANNVTRQFPNIKFILSHSGGFVPFAAHRMGGFLNLLMGETPEAALTELQKFYVDLALSITASALPSTLQFIPNNQITYGTDYPYVQEPVMRSLSQSLDDYPLANETRHHINFQCANDLLQTSLSYWRRVWHQDSWNTTAEAPLVLEKSLTSNSDNRLEASPTGRQLRRY